MSWRLVRVFCIVPISRTKPCAVRIGDAPTEAALLWRLKSGRRKPIVDAQGGLGLSSLAQKHRTLMVAWRELFSFRPEAFDLLVETMRERQNVFEPATLHDTTSCLRVLAVGFCSSNPNMPRRAGQFQSEQFTVSHRAEPKGTTPKIQRDQQHRWRIEKASTLVPRLLRRAPYTA